MGDIQRAMEAEEAKKKADEDQRALFAQAPITIDLRDNNSRWGQKLNQIVADFEGTKAVRR